MAVIKKRDIGSDRKRVAGGQEHEVKYEATKKGTSKAEVKQVVKEVGVSRGKVEDRLSMTLSAPSCLARHLVPGSAVRAARVAVGACSTVARRLAQLEQSLVGLAAAPGLGGAVALDHLAALAPIDDDRASAAHRLQAARVLVARTLERCVS